MNIALGSAFFEQRLLPVRLIRTTESYDVGPSVLIPKGALLYMVFNAAGRTGYCTTKDRSLANQTKTLFMPLLDTRPCLTDSDGDGRFDRVFSVFDKYGGPPSARGSIDGAKPIAKPVAYERADPHEYPKQMGLSFELRGNESQRIRVSVSLKQAGAGEWYPVFAETTTQGSVVSLVNTQLLIHSIADNQAAISYRADQETFISSDNRGTLYWSSLPAALR